jgi:hypothetical protein
MSARNLDLAAAVLADNPSEWPEASDELRAWLADQPNGRAAYVLHSPRCLAKTVPVTHPITRRIVHEPAGIVCAADCPVVALERLMAERWFLLRLDDRVRCRRCKGKHAYVTRGCVELPLSGLGEIMLAIRTVNRTARHEDTTIEAIRLGDVVPITATKAQELRAKIAAKGLAA